MLNTSGITTTTHDANGANITNYDWLREAAGAVLANNFDPNAHILAPRTVTSLAKLKEGDHQRLPGAAGLAAAPATHQADPDQPHRRHQHRRQRDLHRPMGSLMIIGLRTVADHGLGIGSGARWSAVKVIVGRTQLDAGASALSVVVAFAGSHDTQVRDDSSQIAAEGLD